MDGLNLTTSLQTEALDTKGNIRSEIADLSRASLQNALANTPQVLTPQILSFDEVKKPDFSKMSDEEYTKNYLSGTLSEVFYKNPAIKRAPIFSDYNYAKKYDDPVLGFSAYRSYEEQEDLYADYLQSGFVGGLTTGLKGLTSRALSIVPKIAAGFGHVGGAVIDVLDGDAFKGQWNYAIDNSFARMMHNADEGLREAVPIYADADYFNGGMWDKVMTGKFIADDMLDGIAYAASSMVNVPILGLAGKGLGAIGKGLNTAGRIAKVGKLTEPIAGFAKNFANETALGNTLLKANKALQESKVGQYLTAPLEGGSTRIANWAKTGGYSMFNTFSEAGAEAYDLKKTLKEELIASGYTEEDAEKYATERAQETLNGNLIGLWASNLWELKTVFPKMFNSAATDIKALQRKVRLGELNPDELRLFNKEVLKKVGTGIAVEGFYEENFQTSLQQYEKSKLLNTDDEGFFDTILGTVSLMGKNASAFLKGVTGGYQSLSKDEKEGADSILLGSLIGMGMGAGGQVIQNKRDRSYLRDYKKQYLEYGNYQHGLFTLLADDKRNILKSFTKTNPDGTTKRSYLNDNNEHEYDQDNVAKLLLFNLDNKKLYNEYMQRVMMGDEVGASFLLDQAFSRLAYQAINNKFWQGDTKSAIEDLKLKIKDFEFEEDKEDLNMKREVEKRLSIIDQFEEVNNTIEDQLKDGFDITTEEGQFQHLYSKSAMFYEATKLTSLKRLQEKYAAAAMSGDVVAKEKFDQLEKLIEDATNSYNQFSTKDSRKNVFDTLKGMAEESEKYKADFDEATVKQEEKIAERNELITNAQGRELTDDEKTKLETIDNELETINEGAAKLSYERFEYLSKTDTYTLYNRLINPDGKIKAHKDVLENFRITREGMVYFRTLNDKKVTDSVKSEIEEMGLDTLIPPAPLSGSRTEILNYIRSNRDFFVNTIINLDKIKSLLDKLKNKTNLTAEDNQLATTLLDAYRALYASIYSPDLESIKDAAEEQLKDFVSTVINGITISGIDPAMEALIKSNTIDMFLDYDSITQSFRDNGIDDATIQAYTDLYQDVALIKDLVDNVLSRPSSLDPIAASSSTWGGHSFNPNDYNAITITQYEALADKDAWLNRSIMVELIADADATAKLFTSLQDADTLDMFDTNPKKIRQQLQNLIGIKQSVSSTERKDKAEYEGVAAKVDEYIEILTAAYKQALENTNAREQEQQYYNNLNKIHLFQSLGLKEKDGKFVLDPNQNELHTLIRGAIDNKFDELLAKAENDTEDSNSQLYYEMILNEIRNAPTSKVDAIVDHLNNKLDKLEGGTHKILKDRSVTLNPSPSSPLHSQLYTTLLRWTGVRFMPRILEDFLKDGNILNLGANISDIKAILDNPSSTAEQKTAANDLLKGFNDESKTDAVTVDIDELLNAVEQVYAEQLLLQLKNDIEINKALFTPGSYFNEQFALASSENFSLSHQQRIAELELTKRFYTLKDSDPNVVSDKIFYLNAVAGSGKTSGVGKWFASKLGLEANEILVTSHLPKSSEVAAKQINSAQDPTLIFDFLEAFKNRGTNTKITVNGIEVDLKKIKLLVIDEMAALGSTDVYNEIVDMVKQINALNENNKFNVVGLGDINQLSGNASGVNDMVSVLNKITILPSLTISYRSSVTAISDTFNQFKGKVISVTDGIASASNAIGEDSFGVHAVNPMKDNVYDTITKQLNASEGDKLIITTQEKKADYQAKFPGVLVFTPEESQSFTIDNVFIDLPLEANKTLYNKKMYVALSRASKYAMFIDYTESFTQNEDKNMRSIIEDDRNQNEQKIELNKKNYISLLDHYLEVLGAKPAGAASTTTAPVAATGPIVTSAPTTSPATPMTPEEIYDNHLDQYLTGTVSGPMGNSLKELVDNNTRYFELAKKFYLSQNGVGSFTAAEDRERSDLLKKMILSFTPEQEAAFDNFLNTLPC